jgi:hypothetical protein
MKEMRAMGTIDESMTQKANVAINFKPMTMMILTPESTESYMLLIGSK